MGKKLSENMIKGLSTWNFKNDIRDKQERLSDYNLYDLCRTQSMFTWHGLPDTIPQWILELYLQVYGAGLIVSVNDNLYITYGALSGELNEYYIPRKFIVTNPYLINKTYDINSENWDSDNDKCVLCKSDTLMLGIMPLLNRYNSQLVENDITFNLCDILERVQALISANTDSTKAAADKMLNDLIAGDYKTIATSEFIGGISTSPLTQGQNRSLINCIEYHQFIKASKYNELGLQANYNMKRESINSNEAQLNEDCLNPLIDDMLRNRKEICDNVNKVFNQNWSVDFNSSWKSNKVQEKIEMGVIQNENTDAGDTNIDNIGNFSENENVKPDVDS